MDLRQQKCVPCEGDDKPLVRSEFEQYLSQLDDWMVVEDRVLERDFKLRNFAEALSFVNKVGEVAESEGHHPDIYLHGWNKVKVSLSTHAIGGLSVNDFVVAVKVDELLV